MDKDDTLIMIKRRYGAASQVLATWVNTLLDIRNLPTQIMK